VGLKPWEEDLRGLLGQFILGEVQEIHKEVTAIEEEPVLQRTEHALQLVANLSD